MKLRIWNIGLVFILAMAFVLGACGNALEGGSTPSGTLLRVINANPAFFNVDVVRNECPDDTLETLKNYSVDVTVRNDTRPNSPTETNSFATITRYRVDFAEWRFSSRVPSQSSGGSVGHRVD